jgi:peptide methionine sulfoxide reductase msrA/msrB
MSRISCLFVAFLISFIVTANAWEAPKKAKLSKAEIKKILTAEQFHVSQEDGTERPFKNEYWESKEDGIYVDVLYGEPLFSSKDKYDSGTGWPSFTQPLAKSAVTEKVDRSFFSTRTEVRSAYGDLHLGHVFDDGPKPTGKRYCMNSAAMRFIPKAKLKELGYGEYEKLFETQPQNNSKSNLKSDSKTKRLVVAGGCFWCMEGPFDKLAGVVATRSGYSGGKKANPTYEETSAGDTGHLEVVEVEYDPNKVNLSQLLEVFWKNIDPYDAKGQFCDKGEQYTSAFFYANEEEKKAFTESLAKLIQSGKLKEPIATKLLPAATFYVAEDYHQNYYQVNPIRYKYYRGRCGRDARLEEIWGKEAAK